MNKFFAAAASAATMLVGAASAAVIDFDSTDAFNIGGLLEGQGVGDVGYAVVTATPNVAIIFNTLDGDFSEDPDLKGPFTRLGTTDQVVLNNILVISDNGVNSNNIADPQDDEGRGGTLTLTFDTLVNLSSIDVVDVDRITFAATDIDGNVITQTFTGSLDQGNNPGKMATVMLAQFLNIQTLTISLNGSGGIDNINFEPIPVPGALPLMITGAALYGARRRKKKQAA